MKVKNTLEYLATEIFWFYAHLRMLYYYNFNLNLITIGFDDDLSVDNWEVFLNLLKKMM